MQFMPFTTSWFFNEDPVDIGKFMRIDYQKCLKDDISVYHNLPTITTTADEHLTVHPVW